MIRRLVHNYVLRTHHWRDIGHNQLSGLYTTFAIRTVAISMIGVFLPIYLYQLGSSIEEVILFYIVFCAVRIPINFFAGYVVGRIGPKHTIAISTIINIVYFIMLFSVDKVGWPLPLIATMYSLTNGLFFTAYHTDFSKIKSVAHAGKEVSHMAIVQRIGGLIGPFAGGLIAGFGDVHISILIATVLMILSLIPLFMTNEPVRTHQHIYYKGLFKRLFTDKLGTTISLGAMNTAGVFGGILWTFYLSLTIFSENAYASIGIITTGSIMLSLFTAKLFGRIADRHGRKLSRLGTYLDTVLSLGRIFINTPTAAVAHNIAGAQLNSARGIPYAKGYYGEADEFPGQRIAYIVVTETLLSAFRLVFLVPLLVLMAYFDPVDMLRYGSVAAGVIGLLQITERFKALR